MASPEGRPFVLLHRSILTSRSFRELSDAAKCVFLVGLAEAGQGEDQGQFCARPAAVADMAALEGGRKAAETAIAELMDLGLLVQDGDTLVYPKWDRYQAEWKSSEEQTEANKRNADKRWHGAGNHADKPKADCYLCQQGGAAQTSAPQSLTALDAAPEATAPDQTTIDEATAVKGRVRERCDRVIALADESGTDRLEAYEGLYEFVTAQAPRFADVKGIGEATLLNVVIDHAAHYYLSPSKKITDRTLSKIHGIRGRNGIDVLAKMDKAAGMEKPMGYFLACYRDEIKAAA